MKEKIQQLEKLLNNFEKIKEKGDLIYTQVYLDGIRRIMDNLEIDGYDISEQKRIYFKLEMDK